MLAGVRLITPMKDYLDLRNNQSTSTLVALARLKEDVPEKSI